MNDISLAMKAAGIKVPVQKERIWRLLKDVDALLGKFNF